MFNNLHNFPLPASIFHSQFKILIILSVLYLHFLKIPYFCKPIIYNKYV